MWSWDCLDGELGDGDKKNLPEGRLKSAIRH
jgi:hypothetical protein